MGCDIDPDPRPCGLTATEKSIVAIARALAIECEMLVLDEPTASLPEPTRSCGSSPRIERLRARGVGMIYVSHRLDEIFRIADRVTVLRDGRMVGDDGDRRDQPEQLVQR